MLFYFRKRKILTLVGIALSEVDKIVADGFYKMDDKVIVITKRVLNLLHDEIIINGKKINYRVLRATHNVGMSSFKNFEITSLENAINDLTKALYEDIPRYKNVEPLGGDFGNGNPI